MIRVPTVFVVGAGGSKPYGFPLGRQLRDLAISNHDHLAWSFWIEKLGVRAKLTEFVRQLRTSGYSSVDQLEQRPEFTDVGTLAIAAVLLPRESHDNLFPPSAPRNDHWYETLAGLLSVGDDKYLQNRVTIVTFNYDRSLEEYLGSVILTRLARGRGTSLTRHFYHVPVIHVHGKLGKLGASLDAVKRTVPFNSSLSAEAIAVAAREIRVIHQARPDTPEFFAARKALREAERVYFLGFGYNRLNVLRLGIRRPWSAARHAKCLVRGTSLGISARDWVRACNVALSGNMPVKPRYRQSVSTFLSNVVEVDD
jgi:hypothetical protein